MPRIPAHISVLADTLARTVLKPARIGIGEISLKLTRIPAAAAPAWQLLGGVHDYEVMVGQAPLWLSIQLFLNPRGHFRIFAFTAAGMLFSVNFTTTEDADGVIALSQRIKFAEGRSHDADAARAMRQAKATMLCDVLTRSGITVTDNMEVELGIFDAKTRAFVDTTPEQFLQNFIAVALLKGHFQGNKGFQFACLPRFDDTFHWKWSSSEAVRANLAPNQRGARGARAIPLGLRFHVLERDRMTCCGCGRNPAKNGIALHVDHIRPYSLGGLTILDNLQTMCKECNLGKGNRSTVRYAAA